MEQARGEETLSPDSQSRERESNDEVQPSQDPQQNRMLSQREQPASIPERKNEPPLETETDLVAADDQYEQPSRGVAEDSKLWSESTEPPPHSAELPQVESGAVSVEPKSSSESTALSAAAAANAEAGEAKELPAETIAEREQVEAIADENEVPKQSAAADQQSAEGEQREIVELPPSIGSTEEECSQGAL